MEKHDKVRLVRMRGEFLDNIVFDIVSPGLLQYQLLSMDDYDKIRELSTNKEKVTAFVDILPSKGPDAFVKFLHALKEDYDWIADELKDIKINQSDSEESQETRFQDSESYTSEDISVRSAKFPIGRSVSQSTSEFSNSPSRRGEFSNSPSRRSEFSPQSPRRSEFSQQSPRRSEFSQQSPTHSLAGSDVTRTSDVSAVSESDLKRKREVDNSELDITEDMIEFISANPRIMKRWHCLANQIGMSNRVPVIQSRIRMEGRDHDEHVGELIREWMERKPGEATVGGLVKLLRSQKFNDTAEKIQDGTFIKKLKSS